MNEVLKELALRNWQKEEQLGSVILAFDKIVNLVLNVEINLSGPWICYNKPHACQPFECVLDNIPALLNFVVNRTFFKDTKSCTPCKNFKISPTGK